jgi:aspartokinase/homoserine dehydrogenase 1
VVILAREAGLDVSMEDVPIESLVPAALSDCSVDEYMAKLSDYDEDMTARFAEAAARGEVLRFVGVVDRATGKGSVELKSYTTEHPFGQLNGSDNMVCFHTKRYNQTPLVVRGPGAGAEVTAGGVFGDLLKLAAYLGAPS